MLDTDDTIVAIATPRAGSVRGIIRVAGPRTIQSLASVLRPGGAEHEPCAMEGHISARRVCQVEITAGEVLGRVPCDVYLWPGQKSYTRQPTAEIHTFGSLPVLDAILNELCRTGARLARPGEFTLRAFLAGRLDLTQAEAVLGVIDAGTENELNAALEQLAGGLAGPLQNLREQLLSVLAHLEAGLDFVEEDIEFMSAAELDDQLQRAGSTASRLLTQMRLRADVRGERRVVLRGLPNVGKSSLFNALAGADCSLVSPTASTTRDYVQARVSIGDRSVLLVDTAGLEAGAMASSIQGVAQRLAASQAAQATVELFCLDSTRPLLMSERHVLDRPGTVPRLIVLTKSDQPTHCDWTGPAIATSARTSTGLESLRQAVSVLIDETVHSESAVVASTAVRCADSLRRAAEGLARAQQLARDHPADELIAAELRFVLDDLGVIVGAVYTDDILDRIFSRFCIGK